jgi:hypothetical protein
MRPIISFEKFIIIDNENKIDVYIGFFYDSPEKMKVIVIPCSDFFLKGNGYDIFTDIKSTLYDSYDEAYKAVDNALYFYYPWQWTLKFID